MEDNKLNKITNKLLKETNDNIVGVSYGYNIKNGLMTKDKVLSFKVKKKLPKKELSEKDFIPPTITISGETYNTDIVEETVELLGFCYPEHYQWWSEWNGTQITPPNRYSVRPLKGGVSVSNFTSKQNLPQSLNMGTLGFIAVDKQDGSIVGVSNNHVLIDDAFFASERTNDEVITNVSGDLVTQPNEPGDYGENNAIGIVKRYVPITQNNDNSVDGALTTIDETLINGDSWEQIGLEGEVGTTPFTFATTAEINNLLDTDPFLYSAGRTTGAKGHLNTKLKISALNTNVLINYNKQNVDTSVIFSDVIEFVASGSTEGATCYFPLAGGDSGSALIAKIDGTYKIIGLCFAGAMTEILYDGNIVNVATKGLACRIDHVKEQLNIEEWDGTIPPIYSDRNNIEEIVINGLDDRKYIEIDNKKYWQVGLTTSTDIYTE
ncbi:MAG: hypothetical protein ACOCVF_00260 [bacterium]